MTITTPACTVTATGDGVTTAFNYNFIIPYQTDGVTPAVLVQLTTGGVVTDVPSGQYSILGVDDPAGGTVTYPLSGSPLDSSTTITITRDLAYLQPFQVLNTSFYPHTVEQVADYLEMQIQQLISGVTVSINVAYSNVQFGTLAAAIAASIPSGATFLQLMGYYAAGDSAPATYYKLVSGSPGAGKFQSADGAWWSLVGGENGVDVQWFGAKLDGATDDTTAWTNALSWANANGDVPIWHPGGNSIYTGAMAMTHQTIKGVDSFKNTPGQPITQTSLVTFHGNNAGITMASASSGGITLEKVGFVGVPGTYINQIGFYMNDAVRSGAQDEGWPTLRDVSFRAFSYGMSVGNKYQTGYVYNVYCADSVINGYQNFAEDWYHYGMFCGSSSVVASGYQLLLGPPAPAAYGAGAHQFIGGAFFGAVNTIGIVNSFGNIISDAYIQNANNSGLVIGDGTNSANNNLITGCLFSGNNQAGGARNVNATSNVDIWIRNNTRETRIHNCRSASAGAGTFCVAAGIAFEGPNNDGTIITGVQFNMDNIVTPGAPAVPVAISVAAAITLNAADDMLIVDNMASYGEQGVYTFEQRNVDMVSLFGITGTASTFLSLKGGSGYISAAVTAFLRDPHYGGRMMTISGVNGAGFNCSTAGALGGGHRQGVFSATGGYVVLMSTGATTWQILSSASVTIS